MYHTANSIKIFFEKYLREQHKLFTQLMLVKKNIILFLLYYFKI